jgi:hypothetical protein
VTVIREEREGKLRPPAAGGKKVMKAAKNAQTGPDANQGRQGGRA